MRLLILGLLCVFAGTAFAEPTKKPVPIPTSEPEKLPDTLTKEDLEHLKVLELQRAIDEQGRRLLEVQARLLLCEGPKAQQQRDQERQSIEKKYLRNEKDQIRADGTILRYQPPATTKK